MVAHLGGKCVDCGELEELEFDHRDPKDKSFSISKMYGLKMEKLLPELEKCVLRCKKCHLIKTREVDGLVMKHGKDSMYRHAKCRCDLCKEAHRLACARSRAKKVQ